MYTIAVLGAMGRARARCIQGGSLRFKHGLLSFKRIYFRFSDVSGLPRIWRFWWQNLFLLKRRNWLKINCSFSMANTRF